MAKKSLEQILFIAIDKIFNKPQNGFKLDLTGIDVEYDVQYDNEIISSGKLDIYTPVGREGKLPVMMYIHGGGFVAGDKHYRRYWCAQFAKMGYVVLNVNYAMSPDYELHHSICQTVKAVSWIESVAEQRNWDLGLFIISGDSAGGYLASETACIVNNPEMHKVFDYKGCAKITNAILICGLYDLQTLLEKDMKGIDLNSRLCYALTKKDIDTIGEYEYYDYILPIKWVNEKFPDSFLVYAEKDVFCAGQGEIMEKKIRECGKDVKVFASHTFFDNHCFNLNYGFKNSKKCNKQIYAYAEELLKARKAK